MKNFLAVETSCDDTCVAVTREDGFVELSFRQDQNKIHAPFGGVVPERASRNHSFHLLPLIDQALKKMPLDQISALVCTNRPGLLGSLLVGLVTVKTLSVLWKKPFIAVNHIEGHILSPFLYDADFSKRNNWSFPYIVLIASGGHTQLVLAKSFSKYFLLGETLDDAAGEAFDKFAKLAGLGYPGGQQVDELSKGASAGAFSFPRALAKKGNLNFSFSGLKTSARLLLEKMTPEEITKNKQNLSASFQEAVVDQIMFKLKECLKKYPHCKRWAVVGGVSANSRLRQKVMDWAKDRGLNLALPPLRYCTDNAGMIGYAGAKRFLRGEESPLDTKCFPRRLSEDFIYPSENSAAEGLNTAGKFS